MLNIKIPFGYNSFCFDHLFIIHTGKIRIKAPIDFIADKLNHCTSLRYSISGNNNQYTILSFTTTCFETKEHLIMEINSMLCEMMHKRIDEKYAPRNWEPEMVEYDYEGFIKSSEPQLVGKIDLSQFASL